MKHRVLQAALLAALAMPAHAAGVLVANDFGAKGDGTTIDTAAVQRALDAASAQHATVTLRPGTYLIGSIFVKSHTHLDLPRDVTLKGIQKLDAYPLLPTRVAGIEMTWPAALVNVYKQQDVQITGAGTIDGDGSYWWKSYWDLRHEYEPRGLRWASDYDAKRPRLLQIFDSADVKLDGPQLIRAGFWTVHICYSHDVLVDHVTIRNNIGGRGPSTDGIDIDSSHNIEVAHADIAVNDDALCLKAGRDADGLRVNRPTTDVRIHDSTVRDGAAGITFGSETSGGFRNVEAWNIHTVGHVPVGILFKSAHTRGGFADNINLHDFTMDGTPVVLRITMNWNPSYSYATIPAGLKEYPAYYTTLTTPVPADKGRARVSHVHIWNVHATGAKTAFEVDAYPDLPLEHFRLDHLDIDSATAGHIADASDWKFSDTELKTSDQSTVALIDSKDVSGIASHAAAAKAQPEAAKKSFAEQDTN